MHIDHIAFHTLKILIHLPLKPRLTILWVDFPKTESNHLSPYTGVWVGKVGAMAKGGGEEGRVDPCANPLIYCIQWLFLIILVCVAIFSICFLLVFHQLSIILVFFNYNLEHFKTQTLLPTQQSFCLPRATYSSRSGFCLLLVLFLRSSLSVIMVVIVFSFIA